MSDDDWNHAGPQFHTRKKPVAACENCARLTKAKRQAEERAEKAEQARDAFKESWGVMLAESYTHFNRARLAEAQAEGMKAVVEVAEETKRRLDMFEARETKAEKKRRRRRSVMREGLNKIFAIVAARQALSSLPKTEP